MKNILVHGNSSTRWKWPTWPDFLSYYIKDSKIINIAKPGISNWSIAREIVNSFKKIRDIDHVYVMWGDSSRNDTFLQGKKTVLPNKDMWGMYDKDFQWTVVYNGKVHTAENQNLDRIKTLESILYTQMFLEKNNVKSTMMIYDIRTLPFDVDLSRAESELKKEIDWSCFKFYDGRFGMRDFAKKIYPDQFLDDIGKDVYYHPLPLAHYRWVKDIMFKSKLEIPQDMQLKFESWKTLNIPNQPWIKDASRIYDWRDDD